MQLCSSRQDFNFNWDLMLAWSLSLCGSSASCQSPVDNSVNTYVKFLKNFVHQELLKWLIFYWVIRWTFLKKQTHTVYININHEVCEIWRSARVVHGQPGREQQAWSNRSCRHEGHVSWSTSGHRRQRPQSSLYVVVLHLLCSRQGSLAGRNTWNSW